MRVIIVHGWGGYPEEGWFPWLKKELEKNGMEVKVPQMPNPDEPRIEEWVEHLNTVKSDESTVFVGHSIGCQTILRYVEKYNKKIGGVVFVAGWFTVTNLEPEEKPIAKPWIETPIDFDKTRVLINKSIAIFSDDDPYVPSDNHGKFGDKLGSEISIEHNKGHFSGSTGTLEVPYVLKAVLKLAAK